MYRRVHIIVLLSICSLQMQAQNVDSLIEEGFCDVVLPTLKENYETKPNNLFVYSKYLKCLFATNDKKTARKVIENFSSSSKFSMTQWDLLAYRIVFEEDRSVLNDPTFLRNHLNVSAATTRWQYMGLHELSKTALERSTQALGNRSVYSEKLLDVYEKSDDVDKALPIYISQLSNPRIANKDVEEKILNLLSTEENMQKAKKYLLEESSKNPNNKYLPKLLLWIYESKNDWTQSLNIAMDLEEKYQANGAYAYALMEDALAVDNYDIVEQALDRMDALYKNTPTYDKNFLNRLNYYLNYKPQVLTSDYLLSIDAQYDQIMQNKEWQNTPYILDYTDIHYNILDEKDEMIALLESFIEQRVFDNTMLPKVELKLGDYFAQDGDRWDALLYYSKVEKAYKNESIGEEARYKNAKLSYYFGDFEWAKDQLAILKTATQEYIANDALELWLRIVDNTPADSNFVPMQQLAKAEWFIWQKEYDSAQIILNSIGIISSPDDPIMADIQLISAHLAHKMGDSQTERKHLERIIEKYPEDILADDAYYELATLNLQEGKKEETRLLLEQFLLKFDNSPLLIEVRDLLRREFPPS